MAAPHTQDHAVHDHVAAVFPDRDHAEAAVADLRAHGLGSEHLGVAVHGTDSTVFEHDDQAEVLHGMEVGAAVGVPAGFLAGLALFALAVPGLAVGGILGLSAVTAGWGAFLGAYAGIGAGGRAGSSHAELEQTSLEPGEILVVACRHEPTDDVESIMRRHGGRLHAPS
jgi:hypothetical protein